MAGIGAPVGNKYGAKAKVISDRLRKICVQEEYKRIDQGLDMLLNAAAKGHQEALVEVMNRLEGKPGQSVDITSDGESIAPVDDTTRAAKVAKLIALAQSRKTEPTIDDLLGE